MSLKPQNPSVLTPSMSVVHSSSTTGLRVQTQQPSALPSSILFLLRFLHPVALLTASFFSFCLPTILYFLAFLVHHFIPHYAILLSRYPARLLLAELVYALVNIVAHITLAILIATSVITPADVSTDVLRSLAVPRYDISAWEGVRFLIPHVLVFVSTVLALLVRIPSDHYFGGKRFIVAWFAHRGAWRRRQAAEISGHKTPALPNLLSDGDDESEHLSFSDEHDIPIGSTLSKRSQTLPINKFTHYAAHRGGLFWSALSTALVGVSYSSLLTFVFLATFATIMTGWVFRLQVTSPLHNPIRYLRVLRAYRVFVVTYLVLLLTFQLPWLVKYYKEDSTSASILRLFGFVPLDTSVISGWTYVMGFAAAIAAYLFTGIFESSLRTVAEVVRVPASGSGSESEIDEECQAVSSMQTKHRPSYYELQFLIIVVHASSIGLLTWALVFPGVLTFPLLLAALIYLSLKQYRNSIIVNYVGLYGLVLHMLHYLFLAVCDAFDINSNQDSAIVRLLGLGSLSPQFSVNIIQTATVALLGVNIFSKHYLAEVKAVQEGVAVQDSGRSLDIEEFVHWSLFSSKSRNRDSLYTPFKLCLDQLALASLYVAGAVDITGLNAVFLVGLSLLCILQSFGLFRKPKIFFCAWAAVFVYSMTILLITGVFCRAVDSLWMCNLDNEGIKSVSRGQVVAYAAVVALSSIQINFTWPYNAVVRPDFVKFLDTRFWRALRSYFLYVSYGSLLLYPLIFPANFVSYSYFFFLFLSICVELIILSMESSAKEIRELVHKYWIVVILYSCGAMLSRYSVRFDWIDSNEATRWTFGVNDDDSRKFAITFGDAILLIIMSLQKRLFVSGKLVEQELPQLENDVEDKNIQNNTMGDPLSSPKRGLPDFLPPSILDPKSPVFSAKAAKHRRYKSMEEYLNENFFEELRSMLPSKPEKMHSMPTRSQSIPDNLESLASPTPGSVPLRDELGRMAQSSHDIISSLRDEEDEQEQLENHGRGNRAGVEQAMQLFRNFRKSVPVKKTEKFLLEVYARAVVIVRGIVLKYSYVLQALAILAASVWLPGISVFGAIYIILGCLIMLSEQTTIRTRQNGNKTQLIAKTMPAVLVILSFSLMSAQYIFLIVHFMDKVSSSAIPTYLGLQTPSNPGPLPITVDAMIAHVLVFVTAAMQRVAVQWARIDAEKLRQQEMGMSQLRASPGMTDDSTDALDIAVPIESVIEGAGGQSASAEQRQDRDAGDPIPVNWAEMKTWKTEPDVPGQFDMEGSESSLPAVAMSAESSEQRRSEQDRIEKFRGQCYTALRALYQHSVAILSLLVPFWSYWGFDVTFTYLIFCGAITTTIFSVLYVIIVLIAGGLSRQKIRKHWHQLTLLLAFLVLVQYFLTLGLPPSSEDESVTLEDSSSWEQWLLLDRDNSSDERKLAITFAFLAVICAGITLNSVSENSRKLRYWLASLEEPGTTQSKDQVNADSGSGLGESQLGEISSESFEDPGFSSSSPEHEHSYSSVGVHYLPTDELDVRPQDLQGNLENQPSLSNFISGLGMPRNRSSIPPQKMASQARREVAGNISADGMRGGEGAFTLTASSAHILSRHDDDDELTGMDGDLGTDKDLRQVEKSIFTKVDPDDFTRRPLSFKNKVKLACMRFTGPLIQLYIFAVASVDTNLFSAVLLGLAFSFIFQFAKIAQKKRRFEIVRKYVIVVILALVIFQAPFEVSSETGWESIVGLLKKDTSRGESVLYLLVSLWILCQIQGRIYESQDFKFVEQYSLEDAKVRFKRAVHEHNSRKYEKMLGRNKSERSLLARKSRLERLKILQMSERTVDAFYDVCVRQEVEFLRKTADSSNSDANNFGSHRFPEEDEDEAEELKPESLSFWSRFVRRLLRGRTWKLHISDPLKSEVKSFIMRYSAWPVYITMLLAAIANPSIPTLVYPVTIFLYLVVEQPRPPKQAWTILMAYVCIAIAVKYFFRSPSWSFCTNVPFFAPGVPSVQNVKQCVPAAGIGFDIFVLLALLGHRAVLYSRGLWDLPMSEEDMLLRSEIRGRECETPSGMEYTEEHPRRSNDTQQSIPRSFASLRSGRSSGSNVWDAEQQYEDVEHILSQARRDILGEVREQVRFAPTVQIVPPSNRNERNRISTDSLKPSIPKASHDLDAFANVFEYAGKDASTKPMGLSSSETFMKPTELMEEKPAKFNKNGTESRAGSQKQPGLFDRPLLNIPSHLGKKNAASASGDVGFWDRQPVQKPVPSSRTVPQSAPAAPTSIRTDVGGPPSTQGSDKEKMQTFQTMNRFRSFRFGALRGNGNGGYTPPRPMTAGQSRVQEALIQGNIIPGNRAYGSRSLALFQVEERGFFARIRNHFSRLTKENDHKTVGDYYLLIFIVDFISFIFVMFGFSAIFGESNSERAQDWWTTNFIETRHLLTLFIMFISLILDRAFYLTRNIKGKLFLQYTSVTVYHIVLFIVQENLIGSRFATRLFYVLRCIYFLLSGLQIRDGFPLYTTAQFLMRNYTTLGIVMFEIYIFVPFLWLTRTLLDWTVLPTSLEIFQYFRFIDIYLWLYRNRAVNMSRGAFRRKLGEKRRMLPRIYQGVGLFLLCVIALFLPFMIFSIFNPFFVSRDLQSAVVSVDLSTFDRNSTEAGNSYEIFSRTALVSNELDDRQRRTAAEIVGVELDVREKEKVYQAFFSPISDSVWQTPDEDQQAIVESLMSFIEGRALEPEFAFMLSASTQDGTLFGTRQSTQKLNVTQAEDLVQAISQGENFATIFESPLPRYSILQSGSSVFESFPPEEGKASVCMRLIQSEQMSFWTMSDCPASQCSCERDSPLQPRVGDILHILQIADVSAIQVGGATILTLYTAILFTIANLLKRFFIDKRLIIPYIDMPYTLHLYQLALDIMYARQDNQLEMEEILYNGLIDIYRDQRELVRWTGERALKIPEAWWDKSESDDPFMVYPSFADTATEPYIERRVE